MMKYSQQLVGFRGLGVLLAGLLLHGCAARPVDVGVSSADAAPGARSFGSQWVQFGVLLVVEPFGLADSEGRDMPAMRMEVVLDDGRSVVVEQALSQAGELNAGDRVRLLQIGGYSQVTFWPYHKGADNTVE